ncbi:MAG: hypothetical protein WCF67_21750 [Chitinophagaceae bacterium]
MKFALFELDINFKIANFDLFLKLLMKSVRKNIIPVSNKRFMAKKKANRSSKARVKKIHDFAASFYLKYGEMMSKLSHE